MKDIIIILTLFCSISIFANEYVVDTIQIDSDVLKEKRVVLIFKPSSLQKTDTVSMIYLLDGEFSRYRYEKVINQQNSIPVIGIGIVNIDRKRDLLYANEADEFLNFISTELIPILEKDWNVKERILFGHSFAGSFTIYSMLNRPNLFDKYIASSPTPIMSLIDTSVYKRLDKELNRSIGFYFSSGTEDMKQVRKWVGRLNENISEISFQRIDWKVEIHEGETHNTNAIVSLIKGLEYLR